MSGFSCLPVTLVCLEIIGRPSVPFRLFIHHSSITETFVLAHLSLVPALTLLSLRSHTLSSVMHC